MKTTTEVLKNVAHLTIALLVILIGAATFAETCSRQKEQHGQEPGAEPIVRIDTIRDTIRVPEPTPKSTRPIESKKATLPIAPTPDTPPEAPDSANVILQIEQRYYADQQYEAWVSGYDAKLDSLNLYQKQVTITKEIPTHKTNRWGISAGAGVVATPTRIEPGIFIGVSYTFVSF